MILFYKSNSLLVHTLAAKMAVVAVAVVTKVEESSSRTQAKENKQVSFVYQPDIIVYMRSETAHSLSPCWLLIAPDNIWQRNSKLNKHTLARVCACARDSRTKEKRWR